MSRVSRNDLKAPLSPEEMAAMWRAIDGRVDAASSRGRRTSARVPGRTARTRRAVARVAIAACFVFVSAALVRMFSARSAPVAAAHASPGPLRTQGGASAGTLDVVRASTDGKPIAFDDGSTVTPRGSVSLAVLENDGSRFALQQSDGSVAYEVTPGGPRRWSVETALGTVEVVGTGFVIDARADELEVTVRHGIVLVRGERVPQRVQRLTAGESLSVRAPHEDAAVAVESLPSSPISDAAPPFTKPVGAQKPIVRRDDARWRELASTGAYGDAFSALGAGGMTAASTAAPVDDLFVLADVARLSGHPAEALTPLRRILRDHERDARAPLAAFTLGRVLDSLGEARAAADAFERAITLGIGDGLREDAHLRRVEALGRAGDVARASLAAREYVATYPGGEAKVRQWLIAPR